MSSPVGSGVLGRGVIRDPFVVGVVVVPPVIPPVVAPCSTIGSETFTRTAGPYDAAGGFIDADIGTSDTGLVWETYSVGGYGGYSDGGCIVALESGALHAQIEPDTYGYGDFNETIDGLVIDIGTFTMRCKVKFDDFTTRTSGGSSNINFDLVRSVSVGFLSDIDRFDLDINFQDFNGSGAHNGLACVVLLSASFDRRASLGGSNYWISSTYGASGTPPGVAFITGDWYNVLWEQDGTTEQRVKIWHDGDPEPSVWLVTMSYSTQVYTPPGGLASRPANLTTPVRFSVSGQTTDPGVSGPLDVWFDDFDLCS